MAQLVMTVLAVALAALLMAGGVTYFSSDTGTRIETVNSLRAQHSAIMGALSSYRLANNGHVPGSIGSFSGYMPEGEVPAFPRGDGIVSWKMSSILQGTDRRMVLCLERGPSPAGSGIGSGIAAFVNETAKRYPGEVRIGASCTDTDEQVCPGDGCRSVTAADFTDAGRAVIFGRL